jgi:hypothetical protein
MNNLTARILISSFSVGSLLLSRRYYEKWKVYESLNENKIETEPNPSNSLK